MRQYDPAIARWTAIDPVTHHSQSTYNGFDNNPIFWADPSGADATSSPLEQSRANSSKKNLDMPSAPKLNFFDKGPQNIAGNNGGGDCCPGAGDNGQSMTDGITLDTVVLTGKRKGNGFNGVGLQTDFSGSLPIWMNSYGEELGYSGGYEDVAQQYFNEFGFSYNSPQFNPWSIQGVDLSAFKLNYDLGWSSWDPNGIGNFWMNFTAVTIGSSMLLPIASAGAGSFSLNLGIQSSEAVSLSYGTMFRNGVYRLSVRNSLGQFATGNGARLTGSTFHRYYGLNSLGQANQFTPLTQISLPKLLRWTIAVGGSALILNRSSENMKK